MLLYIYGGVFFLGGGSVFLAYYAIFRKINFGNNFFFIKTILFH